jgi:hypothetical protein
MSSNMRKSRFENQRKPRIEEGEVGPRDLDEIFARVAAEFEVRIDELRVQERYCDHHLNATLIPAGSRLVGQYGGDKADCNLFRYWGCFRPDCSDFVLCPSLLGGHHDAPTTCQRQSVLAPHI